MPNKQKGFLKILLILVIAVLVLSYFHVRISTVVNYIVDAFHGVFG